MDDEIRAELGRLRSDWHATMITLESELRQRMEGTDNQVTGRVKNIGTLREKLVRSDRGLSSVRDIVGCRVVSPGGREELLDALARSLTPDDSGLVRLIDRIRSPMIGYRALHLEIRRSGMRCEIQFRTSLQHLWADTMERVADVLGRDARYVVDYDFPHLGVQGRSMAVAIMAVMGEWSEMIHLVERISRTPDPSAVEEYPRRVESLLEEFRAAI